MINIPPYIKQSPKVRTICYMFEWEGIEYITDKHNDMCEFLLRVGVDITEEQLYNIPLYTIDEEGNKTELLATDYQLPKVDKYVWWDNKIRRRAKSVRSDWHE